MINAIRSLVLGTMPDLILKYMKKRHYVSAVSRFHESDFDFVRLLIKPGDSVVDIGANAGWYTKYFSDLIGPDGCVYSIEPVPPTYEILVNTIKKLRIENARHYNYALSNKPGMTTMAIPLYSAGGENFYRSHIIDSSSENGLRTFEVETTTLDILMKDTRSGISLVKCDVEGHELQVLEGASRFLALSDAAWLIEISGNPDQAGSGANRVFEIFSEHDYRPYYYHDGQLVERVIGDSSINYFMLKQMHLEFIGLCGL